ncbi:hypothetical protein IFM89_003480 [Coptis chinensis]|uniref:Aminotransferase-like plant mobile domain-containing protein n=1 Tax=Coptis chinensis TaxID=261450 RepID=A0A835HF78_9MAGN|nr:hypothetical protein IFM89_003480 [Coptis chinensis]
MQVSSFNTKYSLSSFIKRVKKLSEDQRNKINSVGFGHLLDMHSQILSKVLLVELLERWDCEDKSFQLPPGKLEILLMDVALILGLQVTGKPVVLEEDLPMSVIEKEYGATVQKRSISVGYLEKRLDSLKTDVTEDFVRSFLLFTLGTVLVPNDSGTVDSRYLLLLKNLERVPQFAWGKAVLDDLFEWIYRYKSEELRYMGGCLIFLQMWSFEHIDVGRPGLTSCNLTFPRSTRWQNSSSRRREWFTTKFEELQGNQIVWRLQPTSEESNIDIIRDLLQMQNENVEISSTSLYSTSDAADVEGKVGVRTLALEEHVIECEDSDNALIENALEVQQDSIEHLSRSVSASTSGTAGDEVNLRAQTVLEMQLVESKKENDDLKSEISILRNQQEQHILELKKEIDNLTMENGTLRNQLSSSHSLIDRWEKILLETDMNGEEL